MLLTSKLVSTASSSSAAAATLEIVELAKVVVYPNGQIPEHVDFLHIFSQQTKMQAHQFQGWCKGYFYKFVAVFHMYVLL